MGTRDRCFERRKINLSTVVAGQNVGVKQVSDRIWLEPQPLQRDKLMRILITNDDGVYSPGIAALAEVATRFAEVRVVAPHVEMSSAAHAISASTPLSYTRTPMPFGEAYRVNGTPADCVSVGINRWDHVDVVLSGVNLGSNLGNAMWHSGTLAGARQAALLGVRGISLSTPAMEVEPDFAALKPWVATVLAFLLPASELKLINVNLPPRAPKGILWTRQSVRHYDGTVVPTKDPFGRPRFWISVVPIEEVEEGTDRWAMDRGYVSMTPLRLDLTDDEQLAMAQSKHPLEKILFT